MADQTDCHSLGLNRTRRIEGVLLGLFPSFLSRPSRLSCCGNSGPAFQTDLAPLSLDGSLFTTTIVIVAALLGHNTARQVEFPVLALEGRFLAVEKVADRPKHVFGLRRVSQVHNSLAQLASTQWTAF